jgi:hypothetical protein
MTTIPKPASLADGLTATYDAWNRLVGEALTSPANPPGSP